MNKEVWAIVGVIVGAVVGGGAQVFTQYLQAKTTRKDALLLHRREAYYSFLAAARQFQGVALRFVMVSGRHGDDAVAPKSVSTEVFEGEANLMDASARLQVVAPDDTWKAARVYESALRQFMTSKPPSGETPDSTGIRDANAAFVLLMKRDLELD